jgi:hypothetical protein
MVRTALMALIRKIQYDEGKSVDPTPAFLDASPGANLAIAAHRVERLQVGEEPCRKIVGAK